MSLTQDIRQPTANVSNADEAVAQPLVLTGREGPTPTKWPGWREFVDSGFHGCLR